jgi:hypothetical protein
MAQFTRRAGLAALCLFTCAASPGHDLGIDATAQPPQPRTGQFTFGTARAPNGDTLGINSQYLTLNGKPILPVMGEFHYARFPAQYWQEELLKMKAAGISIVSTYVVWQYHEEYAGKFDWTGDRDLRRFITLCKQDGLYVFLRPGPWAHAEVRFGGIPDWVENAMPTRRNDPLYLTYVARFYNQIGAQVKGLLWKDGGPVIGAQVENEYNLTGPGEGRAHIAQLKSLLLAAGIDVPLYTVTGWDNTVYPKGQVTPVFGGYPDEPWDRSTGKLPPKSVYAFQFTSRVGRGLGAQTEAAGVGDAESDIADTPFLSAEYGGGVPAMYRRRPVIQPDDVAAMLPVQLGSGVNLYGYYMFQGGRNPWGQPSRQESTAIGGYNDLPEIGYDFGAPLGEYGQAHPVLAKLRPLHAFLRSWGPALATMAPHRPDRLPSSPADLATPRFAVRSRGAQGFLFFNNHVRGYDMAPQNGVRFAVRLPGETLSFPQSPIDIPSGAYFIWPFNMPLAGTTLAWATAQPLTRLATPQGPLLVLYAQAGMKLELAFTQSTTRAVTLGGRRLGQSDGQGHLVVRGISPGTSTLLSAQATNGAITPILILTQAEAEACWMVDLSGAKRLAMTQAQIFATSNELVLRAAGNPNITLALYPALARKPEASLPATAAPADGVFQDFTFAAPSAHPTATLETLRAATPVPPIAIGGAAHAAIEPVPPVFGDAAAWSLTLPSDALRNVSDVYLRIAWQGDVARLFAGTTMLDDQFFDGTDWQIGLKRFAALLGRKLTLTILPLRQDAPIYLEPWAKPEFHGAAEVSRVTRIDLVPEYEVKIKNGLF